jgi:hypothetical protein
VYLVVKRLVIHYICIADTGKRSFGRGKFCDAIKGEEAVSTAEKYDIVCPLKKTMEIFILGKSMGGPRPLGPFGSLSAKLDPQNFLTAKSKKVSFKSLKN